ncbi:nuclease-related domain-containing protein [uncultured Shewanella sp.]|uniref:nuclease-related domain-containing protein n=1 Tax=uncultured Shewanella sp. TaxID=173975 RepID=UPI00260A2FC9|nr:nuclease-related domain-containing protein [uncultured Shewanella sp.]
MSAFTVNLLPSIILFSGSYLISALMYLILLKRDKTLVLPIDKALLQRLPGFGISEQLRDLQIQLIGPIFIATLIVSLPFSLVGFQYLIEKGSFNWLLIIFVLLGLFLCCVQTWRIMHKMTNLRLGYTAELATASELVRLQAVGYQVFHDIQADNFNIDHLIVGPNGVFAIETKGRYKRLIGDKKKKNYKLVYEVSHNAKLEEKAKLVFPSWCETKLLEQAQRQAKWVSHWLTNSSGLSVTAFPILVFPGWFIELKAKPPFPILNHKQLPSVLPKLHHQTWSQSDINRIAHQIAQRCVYDEQQ